eukprot:CAMPEP_0206226596 /NCGR_PEP_ID=MMETSP0047_2-20121206/8180_1 /ASSEMBLY_ACC=CAM_ASM_000192 /TAXON_ID=195065 /ORGANISM="Chroomonas mesostigmatica_cf, Strain CCMP1168" /LENGTH=893 /DNA_ID=CAMNT_0053649703 /DNA_START=88 /DNA_END=2769 /DNA_ORIENTATION=+
MGHASLALVAVAAITLAATFDSAEAVSSTPLWAGRPSLVSNMGLRGGSSAKMTRSASQQDLSKPDIKRPGPGTKDARKEKIWQLTKQYKPVDKESIQRSVVHHVEHTLAADRYNFDDRTAYSAVALSVRDHLVESLRDTKTHYVKEDPKRVYYLSLEFLMGRSLLNALMNLDLDKPYAEALAELGYKLEDMVEQEKDAALGNGGLGRLAACFLDSMATLNLPAWGYGIRYEHGMFEQRIKDGVQVEFPDTWLTHGNPWEIQRLDITYPVVFYGSEKVVAVAYDTPIPGYDTLNTNSLRLWSAMPDQDIDLGKFNEGDYSKALAARQRALEITQVLYPNDNNWAGKELRLKQQYFFVSATLQDMIHTFMTAKPGRSFDELPQKVAVQLNDTHPSIGVAELMRLLIDVHHMGWTAAWAIVCKVFAYTNHTVLPEALEKWPVALMQSLLPRIMEIIFEINRRWLNEVKEVMGNDSEAMGKLSVIEGEGDHKMVRMANLAIIGSFKVNGVAAIHADIVKADVFPHFVEYYKRKGINDKFIGVTNGVTCRRWMAQCNPELRELITKQLGSDKWVRDLSLISGLRKFADDDKVLDELAKAKMANKLRLKAYIKEHLDIDVDENTLFDVQVKRIHEYKRQFLNVLQVIHRYNKIKSMSPSDRKNVVKRTVFIGGKAAAGYYVAKKIIALANAVGRVINADPDTSEYLKLVFIPNYKVGNAQIIIPANDISEHISTAGTEASGTSNMKFVMNGGIIIGTDDGANIEIKEHVGEENIFIFGAKNHEIPDATRKMKNGAPWDNRLQDVFKTIRSGKFGNPVDFEPVLNSIEDGNDRYLLAHDFASYLECQDRVDKEFVNTKSWNKKCLMAIAGMGFFSTDRTINEYAEKIWGCKPCPRPDPRA